VQTRQIKPADAFGAADFKHLGQANTLMPNLHTNPALPLLLLGGAMLGALSWFTASVVSGTFEPYDSGSGLLVNQAILSVSAAVLAWHYRIGVPLVFMASAYLGMNAFAYGFGGSEMRAWVALGARVSLLLFLAPMVLTLGTVALRRLLRKPSALEDAKPQEIQE